MSASFVCLRRAIPEAIARKAWLVGRIEGLLEQPRPEAEAWRRALAGHVTELDDMERPFAAYDRLRFGGPSTRDRLITGVRERFPTVFGRPGDPAAAAVPSGAVCSLELEGR